MTMARIVDYRLKNLVNFFALKIMTLMVSASPIAVVMVVELDTAVVVVAAAAVVAKNSAYFVALKVDLRMGNFAS